jgi:hypothetical protein
MANAMLTLLQGMGVDDLEQFGDSTGTFDLGRVPESSTALGRNSSSGDHA